MIKIEVRENGVFSTGYPYNASVDEYFQLLTPDFIKNYGLNDETVLAINQHKNETLSLDTDLHEFVVKLSAFIVGFETTGKVLISEYDELKKYESELKLLKRTLENKRVGVSEEFDFITTNISQLKDDLTKITELISYYNGQIVDETTSYSEGYVSETREEIKKLDSILSNNDADYDYYLNALETQIVSLTDVKKQMVDHNFSATNLRTMYEEWQKRPEDYFIKLVKYFKDEYESQWTYGSSLMFGEKLEEEAAETVIYRDISDRWQETLFKKYNFNIEKAVKEYSLEWLSSKDTVNEEEFKFHVESKKVEILRQEITNVEKILYTKTQELKGIIPQLKEQNYNKYKELILEKMRYVLTNINGAVDISVLNSYDSQINALSADYTYVAARLSQPTYWKQIADKEMHSELLTDLKRKLDKSKSMVESGFKKTDSLNIDTMAKLEFYKTEKNNTITKINELTVIKSKLEMDNNAYNDEISLIGSKLYENQALITQKINEYSTFFEARIPFFTQNVTKSENEGIIDLLNGDFFRNFDTRYKAFVDYYSPVKWYNVDDRNKLQTLYGKMLNVIKTNLSNEWHVEFDHEIINTKKIDIYSYYMEKETKTLYASVNKHLLDETYDDNYIAKIKVQFDKLKEIFTTYVDIAFSIEHNVKVITNLFNYDDVYEFDISGGNETKENVKETFFAILDNILIFTNNKNMEYKTFESLVDNQQKIDRVWLDMEKKYV